MSTDDEIGRAISIFSLSLPASDDMIFQLRTSGVGAKCKLSAAAFARLDPLRFAQYVPTTNEVMNPEAAPGQKHR